MPSLNPQENAPVRSSLLALSADVGRALTTHNNLPVMLRHCAEALVTHLDAAFARIWVLDEAKDVLVLQASAGLYTHLNGPHGRVPVGQFKIGLIAQERQPHLTNSVIGDPRVSDQEWAAREGMVAFAGHPLIVEDRLVGVIAVFARHPLSEQTIQALGSVADQIAVGIERKGAEEAAIEANRRTTRILESITDAFFTLDREWNITRVNDQAEQLMTKMRHEILGRNFWEVFPGLVGSIFEREYRRAVGEGIAVSFEEFYRPLDAWLEVRAYPSPDGLSIFYQNVTARKKAVEERERLLRERSAHAEREAILNRIGQTIRNASDPEAVQVAAVNLLGEALGADRCYFALYDLGRGIVTIARDWHRADLSSIQGVYPFKNTAEMFRELYGDSSTSIIEDALTAPLSTETKANMERLGLRSRVSVALVEGESLRATLTAAMADASRDWTNEESALVEAVGTQLRIAVEESRLRLREHKIAEQLQAALQPPLPEGVSGLKLARHYEAALAEAGVGGDFYDVFPIEKGCTVLAVGDLSGKGLAAAVQVSTVRNMLRAFLYSKPTLADAVTDLNRVLTLNGLLSGFATLWVGCYDGASGELSYVNLGQEPALLRRVTTGEIEQLIPTGPVLGANENVIYEERTVTLFPGDALAVFTDGATECGASRHEMLGLEGVAALLRSSIASDESENAERMAEAVKLRLVTGVDAASRGGVAKDDLCILVAVAEGRAPLLRFDGP